MQGINPPFPLSESREVQRFEKETVDLFLRDPHGVRNPLLSKRIARGWSADYDPLRNLKDSSVRDAIRNWLDRCERVEFDSLPWTTS